MHYIPGLCPECIALSWVYELSSTSASPTSPIIVEAADASRSTPRAMWLASFLQAPFALPFVAGTPASEFCSHFASAGVAASHAPFVGASSARRALARASRTIVPARLVARCALFVSRTVSKRNKKSRLLAYLRPVTDPDPLFQLLDYDSARSKMRKLVDKPSEGSHEAPESRLIIFNPGRLILTRIAQAQQEHDEAKEVFDMLNDQLVAELPQLMGPAFEAMIRMQSKFAEEGYEKLSGVQRYFADSIRDDYAAGQLDAQYFFLPLCAAGPPRFSIPPRSTFFLTLMRLAGIGLHW
ncbi:hypothetical protein B0H14DRAFT_2557197 [Mycena olivaceomarginata]|nr:hypothetical protein B0H14DRAFT_2557197 [Mycena olivaceomarginata]